MTKRYTPTDWQNEIKDADGTVVQKGTPLNATNLNKLENAVAEVFEESHTHANKELLESIDVDNVHKHPNKQVLDDLTQQHLDNAHTHDNADVLDKLTQNDLDSIAVHSLVLSDHEQRLINITETITSLKIKVVQTISERDALETKENVIIHVVDATGDPTVSVGWAQYIYQNGDWVKIAENESIDIILAWSDIVGKPLKFPPESHTHEKADVGLGNVDNVQQAAKTEFDAHERNTDKHITPAEREAWNKKAGGEHTHGWDEVTGKPSVFVPAPHKHTEADITDLDKYTQREVDDKLAQKAGTALATAQQNGLMSATNYTQLTEAIQTIVDLVAHADSRDNPHGVTKSQVGLGSVENYAVANQLQAETATANNLYMTPLRVAQAIAKNVPTALSGFTNDTNFPVSEAPQIYVRPNNEPPTNPPVNSIWVVT